jgi:hypothetical protein
VLLHEFSNHLVLALQLGLQRGDAAVLEVYGLLFRALEGSSTVLEKLLLPVVEERGPQVILIAEVRDGYPLDQVPA